MTTNTNAVVWDMGRGPEHNVTVFDGEVRYWARVPSDWTEERVAEDFVRTYDVSIMQESDRYAGKSVKELRRIVFDDCEVEFLDDDAE